MPTKHGFNPTLIRQMRTQMGFAWGSSGIAADRTDTGSGSAEAKLH